MWWDVAPDVRADFEDWHAHEHFPERLSIPGFRRATRWTALSGEGIFVIYELESYDVLASSHYLARLNAPTPWSTRMMPHHRNMVRSQNHVLESAGALTARQALTVRLSPAPGSDEALRTGLASLIPRLAMRPGLVGAHLLKHQTPAIAQTTEQRMRSSQDRTADWVFVACGYDAAAVSELMSTDLSLESLLQLGAAPNPVSGLYALAYSAIHGDVV
jgi:hypothetical protein